AQGKRGVEFFIFGGLTGRLVGYNALLQGQFKDSVYTLDANQLNRTILEFQVGPVISFPLSKSRRLGIGYLFSGRTAEFSGPFERTHSWGSLSITIGRPPVIN
ncbi:MAG: lipid A deacylase LpxR family protein, partial [Rhodothermaceae bacterium]|nr:lipid A deacylase LpxR family protein [Rhodothermaceae bacterium]